MKKLSIIVFVFFIFSNNVKADIINQVIYFHCYKELETLEVGLTSFNGYEVKNNLNKDYKNIYKKYGFYNLQKLYFINKNGDVLSNEFKEICKIGKNIYKVTIKPIVLVDRFVSISLTLYKNDELLIQDLNFGAYKNGNQIFGANINNEDEYLTIKATNFLKKNIFFFEEKNNFPINNINIKD